jgi:hypothetical protein
MSKYVFKYAEKYAVWKTYGPQCYWCGEPLRIQDCTIDHVIPEFLLGKPDDLARVRDLFSLPDDFGINDVVNWLPCHDACNRSKSAKVFRPTPLIQAILDKLQREAPKVRRIRDTYLANKAKDDLLGRVMAALEGQAISKDELRAALADPAIETDADLRALRDDVFFHIDTVRWKAIELKGNIAIVSDGRYGGITPIVENPDSSWLCPHCMSYGPWNGIICLTCGHRSDPND